MIIHKNVIKILNTHFCNESFYLISSYIVLQFYAFSNLEIQTKTDQSTNPNTLKNL